MASSLHAYSSLLKNRFQFGYNEIQQTHENSRIVKMRFLKFSTLVPAGPGSVTMYPTCISAYARWRHLQAHTCTCRSSLCSWAQGADDVLSGATTLHDPPSTVSRSLQVAR